MNVRCAWCKEITGTKEPLDNPEETHGICPACRAKVEKQQLYRVYNRVLHQYGGKDVLAVSPEAACARFGWAIEDCWVREYTTANINPESGNCGGGWKNLTPREKK